MLFRAESIEAIQRGDITVTFRAWKTPRVKLGGHYRFWGRGFLEVTSVERLPISRIDQTDVGRAGFPTLEALLSTLALDAPADSRQLYRVEFRFVAAPDERDVLAANAGLTEEEGRALSSRLDRMDRARPGHAWTRPMLHLIAARPRVVASQLARSQGRATAPFKADVRKLKALGLTISHEVGYELSPRGRAYLAQLERDSRNGAGR